MKNDTTTGTLTLFSVRADYIGCEYGSLYIVSAKDEDEAIALVQKLTPRWHDEPMTIDEIVPIGVLLDAKPEVLDSFTT